MKQRIYTILMAIVVSAGLLLGCGEKESSFLDTGMQQIEDLDYDGALASFASGLEAGEDARQILRGEGIAYLAKAEYSNAVECFTGALALSSGIPQSMDYDINYYLATAYYKNGQNEEAIQVYDAILALHPKERDAYYLRGCVELTRGEMDKALADFNSAIEQDPENYDLMVNIYQVLEQNGYQGAGVELLTSRIDNTKDISDFDRGRLAYYTGDYAQAKEALEKAGAPTSAQVTLYLGKTYEALGDYNYAIDTYRIYLDQDSKQAILFNQMGLCQMKMERYEDALESFKSAMVVEDTDIMQTLKYNEIVANEYLGNYSAAAALMSEYLKSYPDDAQAKREYDFLKTR